MSTPCDSSAAVNQLRKIKILVCFAVKEEAARFRNRGGEMYTRVLITGMGRRNTLRKLDVALADELPDMVLTCGFAGGLKPELRRGSVVFETQDPGLESPLRRCGAIPAKFACVDRVAVTSLEKRALRESEAADAVEMESTAVHQECRKRRISCATVRVILDEAGEDLPLDFNALMTSGMRICPGKLIWAIMKSPAKIPALMRFQQQTAKASEALGEVLARVCSQLATGKD